MPSVRLRKGAHLLLKGREYVIDKRLPNWDIRLRDISTDRCRAMPYDAIADALFDGDLEFLTDGGNGTYRRLKESRLVVEALSLLDGSPKKKQLKEDAKRRYRYVAEVLERRLTTLTEKSLRPVIDKISIEINDTSPPSAYSLYRWSKLLLTCGDDIRLLVALTGKRGNRNRKFGQNCKRHTDGSDDMKFTERDYERAREVEEIVDEVISEVYLTPERTSIETTYDAIEARIRKINALRVEEDRLPVPNRSSVYRIISKIPEYEKDVARYGKRYAELKHKSVRQGVRPKRPLERVEMDDTKLDLFVIDPERCMPIGRPTLFTAIDVDTKFPTGFDLSFNAPGYLSVMNCLIHAIGKKTYVKKSYPEITNEWPCYGVMDSLVVDNAKQYWSESLEDAALELNFLIEYSPVRAPWYKASVERFFGTVNRQLLHHQPGTTFSNIIAKKDYDPLKNAVISLETLRKLLHIFIIDIYARETHDYDGFEDVPARRWEEGIREFPPALPPKAADLAGLIGQVVWRVISNNGIELFGLRFNCDKLAALRSDLKGAPAKIKLNPNDLSIVHVADLKNGRYIHVPAKNQEYTKGLTLYQHDVIRRYARMVAKDYVDIEALCRAKETIRELVRREWERSRPSDTRVRQARFTNYGYQIKGEGFEREVEGTGEAPAEAADGRVPTLYEGATAREDTSDLGSSFPILAPAEEAKDPSSDGQGASGSIELHPAPNKPRGKKRARATKADAPGRAQKGLPQEHEAEGQSEENGVDVDDPAAFYGGDWGAEYD